MFSAEKINSNSLPIYDRTDQGPGASLEEISLACSDDRAHARLGMWVLLAANEDFVLLRVTPVLADKRRIAARAAR